MLHPQYANLYKTSSNMKIAEKYIICAITYMNFAHYSGFAHGLFELYY